MRKLAALPFLFFLSAAVLLPSVGIPCGMNTHAEVSHRARFRFDAEGFPFWAQILHAHQDALQAGSTFPDWGYAFDYPNESEEAHWSPFLTFASQYVYDTYGDSSTWDEETEKLAVFLLGMVSHNYADMSWHDLSDWDDGFIMQEGFITAQAKQDFAGDWGAAHTNADNGGEMLMPYEFDMSIWRSWNYYFPVNDMAAIYQLHGDTQVTARVLRPRCFMLALGGTAGYIGGFLLAPGYAGESPFLMEQLQDYFVGGLDDMSVWVSRKWEQYIGFMENGVDDSVGSKAKDGSMPPDHDLARLIEIGRRMWEDGLFDIEETPTERGVSYRVTLRFDPEPKKSFSKTEGLTLPDPVDRMVRISAPIPYNYTGQSLASGDANGDGADDLVIGAPGFGEPGEAMVGRVHLFFSGRPVSGPMELDLSDADATLTGDLEYGRFGHAVSLVDLNADGKKDLAVSAPAVDGDQLQYRGRVFVYFGRGAGDFPDTPDLTLSAADDYSYLGSVLSSGDLNGDGFDDLIVGSPHAPAGGDQRGHVGLIFSSQNFNPAGYGDIGDADLLLPGEQDYDWFGSALLVVPWDDGSNVLLVGASAYDQGPAQSTGKVYGYRATDLTPGTEPASLFTLTGAEAFDKLGSSLALVRADGESYLAAGAPTYTGAGKQFSGSVFLYGAGGLSGDLEAANLSPVARFAQDARFGRLGWRLAAVDLNGDGADELVTTQPWKIGKAGRDCGAMYAWFGGADFDPENPDWEIEYDRENSLFGVALAFPDFNGDGYPDTAVSAQRDDLPGWNSGAVTILISPAPAILEVYPRQAGPGQSLKIALTGNSFTEKGVDARLALGDFVLIPSLIDVKSAQAAELTVSIPKDAPLGNYDLRFSTFYGAASFEKALEVAEKTPDNPDAPGDGSDDDTDDDADDEAPSTSSGQANDDGDEGACGC